ncbi:MAG: hypothetical protein AB7R89_04475 [Dehalococcoidia bacterium]
MANEQALILRDGDGNFYVISSDVVGQSRVSVEQKAALEEALKGDTAGFLFDFASLNSVINVPQTNNATANNVAVGFFTGPQTIAQVQGNVANVLSNQQANP